MSRFTLVGKPVKFKSKPTAFSLEIIATALEDNPEGKVKGINIGDFKVHWDDSLQEFVIESLFPFDDYIKDMDEYLLKAFKKVLKCLKLSYSLDEAMLEKQEEVNNA